MSQTFPARVVSVGKNAAWVVLDSEDTARVADLKRASGKREMLAPGDRVGVHLLEDGRAKVEDVEPRSSVLKRRTAEGREKIMAANVDTIAIVTPLANPAPRTLVLDQLLAYAELEELQAMALFTKPDLDEGGERERLEPLYTGLGYATITLNPKSGEGIDRLRASLHGRHALLAGVSGAGKSSTFKALGGEATVGELSRYGVGRQTTTTARLFRLADGFLIDSPGVAEFGLGSVTAGELVHGFRELREPASRCRFRDCRHLQEPGCAVIAAVEAGSVAASRFESYRRILLAG